MKHALLKLALCFRPSHGRAILVLCLAGVMSALCALPCYSQAPKITSISKITTKQFQTIVIQGSGFGTQSPYTGDSDYISLLDETKKPHWQAGYAPYNDTVTLIVMQWEDTKITLGGFSGAWGTHNWFLSKGDKEQVEIWNAQSGDGPATKYVKIQGATTTITLYSSLNPSTHGQPVTLTAMVRSDEGAPPNGETVTFMQGETVLGTATLTEGWASFTAPAFTAGAGVITAVYDGDEELDGSTSSPLKLVPEEAAN
jgi:hypothetical protein